MLTILERQVNHIKKQQHKTKLGLLLPSNLLS